MGQAIPYDETRDAACHSCRSIHGEERISPGPTVAEGRYWLVEHAYPSALVGWLVLVLKRHAEALHDLTPAEMSELGPQLGRVTRLQHTLLGSQKEYVFCVAEGAGFAHVHVHVVPKAADLPEALRGPRVFALLHPDQFPPAPAEEVRAFCERAAQAWADEV